MRSKKDRYCSKFEYFYLNRRFLQTGIAKVCCFVKNLKPLRKTVNLLGRNSARRASELRKHTGRASFSYTNFVLKTQGIQEEMWKEIQAFWREKKVYDKFTQLRRKHFRHFLSFFDKSLAHWDLRKLDLGEVNPGRMI